MRKGFLVFSGGLPLLIICAILVFSSSPSEAPTTSDLPETALTDEGEDELAPVFINTEEELAEYLRGRGFSEEVIAQELAMEEIQRFFNKKKSMDTPSLCSCTDDTYVNIICSPGTCTHYVEYEEAVSSGCTLTYGATHSAGHPCFERSVSLSGCASSMIGFTTACHNLYANIKKGSTTCSQTTCTAGC